MELEVRADDDDRAAGVVHALAEQVLAEPALLALEHVGQALEAVVAGAGDRPAAAAVVDQGVARLLEHPLLVADDDLGCAQLEQPLESVVPVDHAAVEVVEVRGGEPAAVELDHRAQIGRDHRQDREDHPLGAVAGAPERLDQAQALDRLLAALAGAGADLRVEGPRELLEVHPDDDVADGLGAHARPEDAAGARARAVLLVELAELHLADGHERLEGLDLVARLAQLVLLALGRQGELLALVGEGVLHGRVEVRDLLLGRGLLAGEALLGRGADALDLRGRELAQAGEGLLAALVAGGHDDLAGGAEGDRVLGGAGAQGLEQRLDALDVGARLVGVGDALGLDLGPRGRERRTQLSRVAGDVGPERGLEIGEDLAGRGRHGPRPARRAP